MDRPLHLSRCLRQLASSFRQALQSSRRYATAADNDMERSSFLAPTDTPADTSTFDPVGRSRRRKKPLPSSRYNYRPPRYYRGPLHPHQPPPASDPASREFKAGPFSLPRLEQTFQSTIESDLMTLFYHHNPPGFRAPPKADRLRRWVGDSPYFENRGRRGPRGADTLRLLRQQINWQNVPKLESVTVHSMTKLASQDMAHLDVASMVLQAITGVKPVQHKVKHNDSSFGIRASRYISLTATMTGEDMHHFLSKTIDVVLPKVKNYRGIKGSSGDNSGNLTFGLTEEAVALYPEVEINYDSYPPKMIPGCHITIQTSARTDKDARMLLGAIGLPFYGKLVD